MAILRDNLLILLTNAFGFLANRLRSRMPLTGYVVLDVRGSYPERKPPKPPLPMRFIARGLREDSVEAFVERLERVAGDPSPRGVVVRIGPLRASLAAIDSLRRAIARFRSQGKEAVAYFTGDVDLRGYYLATSAGRVVAAESAHFTVTGLSAQVQFLRDALAKWGVRADFESIGAYKTAVEPLTRSDISQAHKEMLDSLLDAAYAEVVGGIGADRRLTPERVRQLIDEAPFDTQRAVQEGLLDAALYEDGLARYLGTPHEPATMTSWRQAAFRLLVPYRRPADGAVSIVSVRGAIVPGESRELPGAVPFIGGLQAGSETIVRALRHAAGDRRVKAVVCYVDSPGGSALASDLIWRELSRTAERKPVVAYMGGVAASGGYYVAAGARWIVAHPQTLTGSIGVLGGKLVLEDLYRKAGVRTVLFARGKRSALFSSERPFDPEEREAVRRMLEDTYVRFKERVALGRRLDGAAVEERAQGRVWTGSQALENGLVDQTGDLQDAVARAKALAGLREFDHVEVVDVTPPQAFVPPWDGAQRAGEAMRSVGELRRELCWALMPWAIRLE